MINDDIYIIAGILNIFITGFVYELIPLIARFCFKDKYSKKEAIKATISNSILVYIIFSSVHLFLLKDGKIANINAAWIWGIISYYIIPKEERSAKSDEQKK